MKEGRDVGCESVGDVLANKATTATMTMIATRPPVLILNEGPDPEAPASVSTPFVEAPGSEP